MSVRKPVRIVLLGGNGQVAAEVALRLAHEPGIDVRPVARTRGGSAFLRLNGIEVWHGDVSRPDEARAMLEGADVVANFALASGSPHEASVRNRTIIEQSVCASPPGATIVFLSTLAVHGEYDLKGHRRRSYYGQMKLANERQVRRLARRAKRRAYILRLGHVIGAYQGMTEVIRSEILDPPVQLPFPERLSNVTATVTIADALVAIAENRVADAGTYDLVNLPNWTWREVYAYEAQQIGWPLVSSRPSSRCEQSRSLLSMLISHVARSAGPTRIRELTLEALGWLPASVAASAKATYATVRARREIAELVSMRSVTNSALLWPAIKVKRLPGLQETRKLLDASSTSIAWSSFNNGMTSGDGGSDRKFGPSARSCQAGAGTITSSDRSLQSDLP